MKPILLVIALVACASGRPEPPTGYNYPVPQTIPTTGSSPVNPGVIATGPAQIHRHVYFHAAPEEPEEIKPVANVPVVTPQKHYKIIFIKAPSAPTPTAPVIPIQPQNEEKTLVYVLVKKPEDQQEIVIPTPAPAKINKPEVFFVKYKTNREIVKGPVGQEAPVGQIVGNTIEGHGVTGTDSYATSGSLLPSSGVATSYGPPQ